MPLIKDLWFPNGAQLEDFDSLATNGVLYNPPSDGIGLPEVDERISLVTLNGETVCKMVCYSTDPVGTLFSKRTQLIVEQNEVDRAQITNWAGKSASRRWYRWKVMLSPDFQFEEWDGSTLKLILWQVHDNADDDDYVTTPPIWMQVKNDGYFWFDITSCADALTTGAPVNYTRRTYPRVRLVPGVPAEFVLWARFAYDTDGEMKIWQDGRLIWSESGVANCFNNIAARGGGAMYNVLNVYCPSDAIDRTVYHWGSQIGDEEYTTFNEFMVACGSDAVELEPFVTPGVSIGGGL